jgi:gamma-glutamyl-gamma-aminobutyrate hydrolase PuuD
VNRRNVRPLVGIPRWKALPFGRTGDYLDSVRAAGGHPVLIERGAQLPELDGLLLTGGVDIDAHLYGEPRDHRAMRHNEARDAHELFLINQALERDLPVLAICRSHHLLNVAMGGSLLQHIEGDGHRADGEGRSRWHTVSLAARGGLLGDVYRDGKALKVNSRHHQAVTAEHLAAALTPLAYSPDGLVEAVQSRAHRWVVGVQWHPERPEMRPAAEPLFAAFVSACRG